MTARVTPLGRSLLAVASWALVLAVLLARPEPFLVVVPLLLALAALARRSRAPDYALAHEIFRDRLFEGETVIVTVLIAAKSPIPLVELLESLCSMASSAAPLPERLPCSTRCPLPPTRRSPGSWSTSTVE